MSDNDAAADAAREGTAEPDDAIMPALGADHDPEPVPPPTRVPVQSPGIHSANFQFPRGFLWGAATSAYQVEGGITNNDWAEWARAGKVAKSAGIACDHYNRFREDFDLAQEMDHNAHRFSIEWSRIEPEEGVFSNEAIEHYRDVLLALHERHIEPVVTLFHYTFPLWMAKKGGWESNELEDHFLRYVTRMAAEFGDLVRWWITINEPVVQAYKGWLLGQWPPGKSEDFPGAIKVVRRMMRSHVKAYHAIHEHRPDAMVSVAKHLLAFSPCDPDRFSDRISVRIREYLFNGLLLDALHTGVMRVPGLFWERLPSGRTLDFIGINYYTRDFVHNTGLDFPGMLGNACPTGHHRHIGKRNSLGWEVYPEGLAYFLRRLRRYKLPILITENGVPATNDNDRWTFIYLHLWQVARAIDDGVPLLGYLYWSLLDNYEWADGFKPRFGLVAVDYATQERTIRHSARLLAKVIRRNQL